MSPPPASDGGASAHQYGRFGPDYHKPVVAVFRLEGMMDDTQGMEKMGEVPSGEDFGGEGKETYSTLVLRKYPSRPYPKLTGRVRMLTETERVCIAGIEKYHIAHRESFKLEGINIPVADSRSRNNMQLTIPQAERIIHKYHPDKGTPRIKSVEEYTNEAYSYDPNVITYRITLAASEGLGDGDDLPLYLLYTRPSERSLAPSDYAASDLSNYSHLVDLIRSKSSVPLPQVFEDASFEVISLHYLLFAMPPKSLKAIPLSIARASGDLSERGISRLELEIGAYLGQMHNIQNDWFGLPSIREPADPSYSWQESFTLFLETLIHQIETSPTASTMNIPFSDIKKCLSRAIGSFLFDDVEVPSLIGVAIAEDDVLVTLTEDPSSLPSVCAVLPNLGWALWGDPLLEAFFMPPGPSAAIMEGYTGAGGSNPIIFARHKTKRLWYSLFMSLLVIARGDGVDGKKGSWALETAHECAKALKNAPCY